jgi:hypothetical protein
VLADFSVASHPYTLFYWSSMTEIEPNTGDTSVQLKAAGQMQSTPIH